MTESKNSLRDGADALLAIGAMLTRISDDMRAAGLSTSADLRAVRWEAVARENQKRADEAERLLKSQRKLEDEAGYTLNTLGMVKKQLAEVTKERDKLRESNAAWQKTVTLMRERRAASQKTFEDQFAHMAKERDALQAQLVKVTKARDGWREQAEEADLTTKRQREAQESRDAGLGEVIVSLSRIREYRVGTPIEPGHVRLLIDTQRDSWLHNAVRQQQNGEARKGVPRSSRNCCEAGKRAYPAPCPWHGDGKRANFDAALEAALCRKPATPNQVDDSVPPGIVRYTFEVARQSDRHHELAEFVENNQMYDLVKIRWSM